jgi:hypothetical protein
VAQPESDDLKWLKGMMHGGDRIRAGVFFFFSQNLKFQHKRMLKSRNFSIYMLLKQHINMLKHMYFQHFYAENFSIFMLSFSAYVCMLLLQHFYAEMFFQPLYAVITAFLC